MILDNNDTDVPRTWKVDVCIVGAGAAGITLARDFASRRFSVLVIEAGGFIAEADSQELYRGHSTGQALSDPMACRLRFFGGTTNHWEGWCGELDTMDFARREWVPDSGWPITAEELAPYYATAAQTCEIDATSHAVTGLPAFDASRFVARGWRFSPPTRFGTRYRDSLARSNNVTVLLHANLTRIDMSDTDARVQRVLLHNYADVASSVEAAVFVLACGGLENPRLLLAATNRPEGIGNRHDLVGRYFMQHLEVQGVRILATRPGPIAAAFAQHERHRTHLTLSAEEQRRGRLLRCGFGVSDADPSSRGTRALTAIGNDLAEARWPDELGTRLHSVLTDLNGVARDSLRFLREEAHNLSLLIYGEQSPNRDSRVTLSDARDRFGLRTLVVDWRLTETDKRSIRGAVMALAAEFGRLQLGRVHIDDWLLSEDNQWPEYIWSGCHHMGTTRMATSPAHGVVNADCRVHDVENLYIAGSSVFATGGYVMPTLTITALAHRLAAHLMRILT
ncbi:MAG: GMC family oxidoreductase [Pseudomonadales bacterium]|nr:GMC family oxidoreductase [Pseudomonadales bacterium]